MSSICGADCKNCEYGKTLNCKGCSETNGCPFGKKCFIAEYIKTGGKENYELFVKQLIKEFKELGIEGLPEIKELFALGGAYVNLEYTLPGGNTVKFLDDNDIYLGTQVESQFSDDSNKCYGLLANMDFLLVCKYGLNGADPELVLYKKR